MILHPPSNRVLFSNPHSGTSRVNGVLQSSSDNARTWQVGTTIDAGSFGYSCLALLPAVGAATANGNGSVNATHVGVIYEGRAGFLLLARPPVALRSPTSVAAGDTHDETVSDVISLKTADSAGPQPAGWRCHCAGNQSLCSPLSTAPPTKEVFAYWEQTNGMQGLQDLFTDSVVTTIAVVDIKYLPDEMLCYAHSKNVRVVMGCIGCDVWASDTDSCPGHTSSSPANFSNATARTEYVHQIAVLAHDHGYDGVSLDMEGGVAKNQEAGLTALVVSV